MQFRKTIKLLGLFLCVMGIGGMALADSGLGVFGAYWSTDDADEGFGLGAKLSLGADPVYFVARGTFYQDLLDDDEAGDIELQAIPVDAGLEFGGDMSESLRLFAGGGVSYCFLELDGVGELDDEVGWYVNGGIELRLSERLSLFGEVIWRGIEGTVEDDDLGEITGDVDLDLSGFGAHVGLVFR
jgi:hypothetical protein